VCEVGLGHFLGPGYRAGMEAVQEVLSQVLGGPDALAVRMGIVVVEATPERVVGTMPVAGNTQPYGLLHGGASCVLAESLGSVGAALHAYRTTGGLVVGVDINATHHRSVRSGLVTGVATPAYLGRTTATYEIVISAEGGARVCTARLTCLLRMRGLTTSPRVGE
jgi:1,4-dihydroxy-2-naphthoyl-CoA hydrolase